jgi:hypothetical protein
MGEREEVSSAAMNFPGAMRTKPETIVQPSGYARVAGSLTQTANKLFSIKEAEESSLSASFCVSVTNPM